MTRRSYRICSRTVCFSAIPQPAFSDISVDIVAQDGRFCKGNPGKSADPAGEKGACRKRKAVGNVHMPRDPPRKDFYEGMDPTVCIFPVDFMHKLWYNRRIIAEK